MAADNESTPKRRPGRPFTGLAKSSAERQRAFAARRKDRLLEGQQALKAVETSTDRVMDTRTWLRILADELKAPREIRDWSRIELAVERGLAEAEHSAATMAASLDKKNR